MYSFRITLGSIATMFFTVYRDAGSLLRCFGEVKRALQVINQKVVVIEKLYISAAKEADYLLYAA